MSKPLVVVVLIASLGAGAAALVRARAASPASASVVTVAAPTDERPANDEGSAEIRRLRAELQTKDRVIRELTAQGIVKDAEKAAVAAATEREPAVRACEVLDQRLAAAPSAPGAKAEMEQALRGALDPKVLGAARLESLQCSGALCKVAMTADSDADVEASVGAMAEQLPKMFAATVVYATEDGERSVYLARSADDLAVDLTVAKN
jgi:hypothetical protein